MTSKLTSVTPKSKKKSEVRELKDLNDYRLLSKLVYVLSSISLVFLAYYVIDGQWGLPIFYTVVTPILLLGRFLHYWGTKSHYFLLELCYFTSALFFIYIWFRPHDQIVFTILFSLTNGPLIWALLLFQDSVTFHDLKRLTTTYIHLVPSYLTFAIRWYPERTSQMWHSEFQPDTELGFSFVKLVAYPYLFLVSHQVLYVMLVDGVTPEYWTAYRYFISERGSRSYRICDYFGERFRYSIYLSVSQFLAFLMVCLNLIWYNYFIPHCILLATFTFIVVYNGATYYMDVFRFQDIKPRPKRKRDKIDGVLKDSSTKNLLENVSHDSM